MRTTRVDELESIVRTRICAVCADRTTDGICGLEQPDNCSLFRLFPLVAQAILATDSDNLDDYIRAIHENVCSVCVDQTLDGTCPLRDQARCALDAHMAHIIGAIREANLTATPATPRAAQ